LAGPKLLRAFAGAYPEAVFIEIGANDGEVLDPLRPFIRSGSWSGVLVEPVPHLFEQLRRTYAGSHRVSIERSAIGDVDGMVPFFHLDRVEGPEREHLPDWYDAIGSFSRDHVLRHAAGLPDCEPRLIQTEVPCLTFESLCRKHGIEGLDLLLIDTEGYDYEIVKQIDFRAYRPRLLAYEHSHLSAPDREECRTKLEGLGYETMEELFDTWCLDTRPDDRLTRMWHRLRPAAPGTSMEDWQRWFGEAS
jgi:FkbM family methyltransferase